MSLLTKILVFFQLTPVFQVLQFHKIFRGPIGIRKEVPDGPHAAVLRTGGTQLMSLRTYFRHYAKEDPNVLRMALYVEELAEMAFALANRDIKSVLDAGGDIQYINNGMMIACGLHMVADEASNRIHISNLSKTDENGNPIFDQAGKIVKGPNYKPVDLTDLVEN